MAKKMNGKGFRLKRVGIIDYHPYDSNKITIDVKCLFKMTDEELMSYRNIGPKYLAKINAIPSL